MKLRILLHPRWRHQWEAVANHAGHGVAHRCAVCGRHRVRRTRLRDDDRIARDTGVFFTNL